MIKNPFFSAVLGLMAGLLLGYVLAEQQPVPPAKAMQMASPASMPPEQTQAEEKKSEAHRDVEAEAGRLRDLLAKNPEDVDLMRALGNLYFDGARWEEARIWYERVLEKIGDNADVETDLAVVYRNLKQPDRALNLLEKVVREDPSHWQGWYNLAVVQHFDLHEHEKALESLGKLEALAKENPSIPDISGLASQIRS